MSVRNLNAVYIVARPGGEVVWRYYDGLDWQHEARMVPEGFPGAGNIQVFNNGYHGPERQTNIIELNPVSRSIVWSYRSPGFFSSTGGTQQVLSNGNLLVTSSRGGRVFELTRDHGIVWQWTPPYLPMRVARYPYDYCPQLASLPRPPEQPIERRDPEGFIDRDVYAFALTHEARHVSAGGPTVGLLRQRSVCQELRLPEEAVLGVGYGIERRDRCEPDHSHPVRFGVSIRPADAEASEDLLERTVVVDDFQSGDAEEIISLRRETFSLARFGRQKVELCLSLASASGRPPSPCFVWEAPSIRLSAETGQPVFEEEKSAEVLEHERQQLEALGYVN